MYKKILESLSDIIYLYDSNDILVYTNNKNPIFNLKKMSDDTYLSDEQKAYYKKETMIELDEKQYRLIHFKENTDLYQIIISQSRDSITGIANRLMIDRYLKEKNNTEDSFTVAMIDIDYFKKINDNFGHLYGDQVLAELAALLKYELSNIDFVGRYGGEEFLMIINSLSFFDSLVKLDEIRRKVENYFKNTNCKATISIGASEYIKGIPVMKKVEEADNALYNVKRNGRNNVGYFDSSKQEYILVNNDMSVINSR